MDENTQRELIFVKISCSKLMKQMNQQLKFLKELNDCDIRLCDFLIDTEPTSHANIMRIQISITIRRCTHSRMLIDPVIVRLNQVLEQYIKHGISDTMNSFESADITSKTLNAYTNWVRMMTHNIGYATKEKLYEISQIRNIMAYKKSRLNTLNNIASDKFRILVTSRNMILSKEFRVYLNQICEHMKLCRDKFKIFLDEFSGLPYFSYDYLRKKLGPNNGVGSTHIEKYLSTSLIDTDMYKKLTRKISMINFDTELSILDENHINKSKKSNKYSDDIWETENDSKREIPTLIRLCDQGDLNIGNGNKREMGSNLQWNGKKLTIIKQESAQRMGEKPKLNNDFNDSKSYKWNDERRATIMESLMNEINTQCTLNGPYEIRLNNILI